MGYLVGYLVGCLTIPPQGGYCSGVRGGTGPQGEEASGMVWIVERTRKGHAAEAPEAGAYGERADAGAAFLALYEQARESDEQPFTFEFDRIPGEGYFESRGYAVRLFPAAMGGPNV